MNKKLIKIFVIMLTMIICAINISYGFSVSELTGDTSKMDEVYSIGDAVIGVLAIIGSAASIIFLIILGMKYMMGSIEEKAQYKKTLFPYIIGAVFVFGASTIASIIFNIFN